MIRKIYLVRHGMPETMGEKRYLGTTDVPLSELGKKQATRIGRWFLDKSIERIYTSPLSRCLETAARIKKAMDFSSAVWVKEELHEMPMGMWENHTFAEIRENYPEEYEKRGKHLGDYTPEGGESFSQGGKRFEECLDEIRRECKGNILVVAHAGVIRGYLCRVRGISADEAMSFPQSYGGVTILEEKDGILNIQKVGWKPYKNLEEGEIQEYYEECGTPEPVIRHMYAVADFLDYMHRNWVRVEKEAGNIDWDLLQKAALLHDLKRVEKDHSNVGADFLEKVGYPEIAALVRQHHRGELHHEALTEEELLFYADKRVQEDKVVSLEERFLKSKEKCHTEEALEKHKKLYEKSIQIQNMYEVIDELGDREV